jgi:hypothetical protein
MKKILTSLLFLGFLIANVDRLQAQGGPYFKVISIKQPCFRDGEIELVIKGAKQPYRIAFCFGDTGSWQYDTFRTDTLKFTRLMGGSRQASASIYGYDSLGNFIDTSFSFSSPVRVTNISVTPDDCPGNTGAISVDPMGGTTPYTYSWNDPSKQTAKTATGLKGGNYTCTVKDANGCGVVLNSIWDSCFMGTLKGIHVPTNSGINIALKSTRNVCLSDSLFEATPTGGKSPYSVLWYPGKSTGTQKTITKPDTIHSCEVTDANGCTRTTWLYPNVNTTALTATTKVDQDTCGRANGRIALTMTNGVAPYSYLWNNGQTTSAITGLKPGGYGVQITDMRGCGSRFYFNVPSKPLMTASFSTTSAKCQDSSGSITTTVSGGITPYTYLWNNGKTTASLSKASSGYYYLNVKDNSGCDQQFYAFVSQTYPLVIVDSFANPTNCGTNDGVIDIHTVNGSTGPIKYEWYRGGTKLPITTRSSNNLPEDYYYIVLRDSIGCAAARNFFLQEPAKCKGTVSGKIYADINKNNTFDAGDRVFRNAGAYAVNSLSKYYSANADVNGDYSVIKLNPSTYNVYPYNTLPKFWSVTSPSNGYYSLTISSGSNLTGNDFVAQTSKNIRNLGVTFDNFALFRPGFDSKVLLHYKNEGTSKKDATVTVQYDALISFTGSVPAHTSHDATNRIITFDLKNLEPISYDQIELKFKTGSTVSLGKLIRLTAVIDTPNLDDDSTNNRCSLDRVTVGAYDPNDKQVNPDGPGGKIPHGFDALTYTVRFQNTGTYPASFVIIRDTLESNIDAKSVEVINSSHDMKLHQENNALKFHFADINLPDSSTNPEGSVGFVTYKVKLKQTAPGTIIKNKAYIYFDYNEPIITNTATTTLVLTGVRDFESNTGIITVSPNPNNGDFEIRTPYLGICQAEISDMSGRSIWSKSAINTAFAQQINGLNLNNGVYIFTLNNGQKTVSQKFMVRSN